ARQHSLSTRFLSILAPPLHLSGQTPAAAHPGNLPELMATASSTRTPPSKPATSTSAEPAERPPALSRRYSTPLLPVRLMSAQTLRLPCNVVVPILPPLMSAA